MTPSHSDGTDDLLRPREVADLFGVRTTTIARWAREGKLTPLRTPGGHRRYKLGDICRILSRAAQPDEMQGQMTEDGVRLYNQGWSIRQVAERFDCSYGMMRRILIEHANMRSRGGKVRLIEM